MAYEALLHQIKMVKKKKKSSEPEIYNPLCIYYAICIY